MKKTQNIKGKLLFNQIATHNAKEKKLGRLSLHENWTRTFVLRISVCFFAAYRACVQGPVLVQTHLLLTMTYIWKNIIIKFDNGLIFSSDTRFYLVKNCTPKLL